MTSLLDDERNPKVFRNSVLQQKGTAHAIEKHVQKSKLYRGAESFLFRQFSSGVTSPSREPMPTRQHTSVAAAQVSLHRDSLGVELLCHPVDEHPKARR